MANASLVVRISAQMAEFQSAFKDSAKTIDKFASEFEGAATRASAVGTFIGNIASDIAKSIASGLGSAAKDAVRLSSEFANAFTGLSSVAAAFGTNADVAKDAAKRLAQDGLLPVKDAASGLKNLLAAGFSLPEATRLMNAFKDSAAFGRVGALSFGDAVRTATEGVKNGNCLVSETPVLVEGGVEVPIGELFERGAPVRVYSLCADGAMRHTAVSHVIYNGKREVFDLSLSSGKRIRATGNHRFLTPSGWKFLSDLTVADEILTVDRADGYNTVSRCQESADIPTGHVSPAGLRSRPETRATRTATDALQWPADSAALASMSGRSRHVLRRAFAAVAAEASGALSTEWLSTPRTGVAAPSKCRAEYAEVQSLRSAVWLGRAGAATARISAAMSGALDSLAAPLLVSLSACPVSVSGATLSWSGFQRSRERSDSALGRAATGGNRPSGWPARITPAGRVDGSQRRRESVASWPTSAGAPASSRETETSVVTVARRCLARLATRTMSSESKTIRRGLSTCPTASPSASHATSTYTLDRDRVVSIESAGVADVYDLSVPETRNFIAGGMVVHNSILVDNAGITKNLSVMLKEAGYSAQDLGRASSDAGVRQALFNGILKESAAFAGDAQRATETYSGQIAKLGTSYDTLLASIGDAVTQNMAVAKALNFVSNQITGLTTNLNANKRGFDIVSESVIIFVKGLAEALNMVDLIQTGFTGLQQFSNRIGTAIANVGITFLQVAEKTNTAMKFLDPLNYQRYAKAARQAQEATTFLQGAVKGFGIASAESEERATSFSNGLQGARAALTTLGKELEATRGKTVALGTAGKIAGDALSNGLGDGASKAVRRIAAATMDLSKLSPGFQDGLPAAFANVGRQARLAIPQVSALYAFINDNAPGVATSLDGLAQASVRWRVEMSKIPEAVVTVGQRVQEVFSQIPALMVSAFTGGGGMLGALKALGVQLASAVLTPLMDGLKKAQVAAVSLGSGISAAVGQAAGGGTTGQIAGIAAGLGGAALAASSWGTSMAAAGVAGTVALSAATLGIGAAAIGAAVLIKKLTDKDGRNAVRNFADDQGGFDALRTKLNELGAEGEQLWVTLTQRVSRGNLQQAESAIAAIQSALEAHAVKAIQMEAEIAAAQQRQADAIDAATVGVRNRIQSLDSEYQSLFKSIENEAPEEVMGIVEAATRARMSAIQKQSAEAKAEEDSITQKIKDNMGTIGIAARIAAGELTDAFTGVVIPPIRVPIEFVMPNGLPLPPSSSGTPTLNLSGGADPGSGPTTSAFRAPGSGANRAGNVMLDGQKVGEYVSADSNRRYRGRTKVSAA